MDTYKRAADIIEKMSSSHYNIILFRDEPEVMNKHYNIIKV